MTERKICGRKKRNQRERRKDFCGRINERLVRWKKLFVRRKRQQKDASCGAEYSILLRSPTTSFVFSSLRFQ